jgi:hypothetical protein
VRLYNDRWGQRLYLDSRTIEMKCSLPYKKILIGESHHCFVNTPAFN